MLFFKCKHNFPSNENESEEKGNKKSRLLLPVPQNVDEDADAAMRQSIH